MRSVCERGDGDGARRDVLTIAVCLLLAGFLAGCDGSTGLFGGASSDSPLAGTWDGTYHGDESGSWTCVVDETGTLEGTTTGPSGTFAMSGSVSAEGAMTAIAGSAETGATFSGNLSTSGLATGTWTNAGFDMEGTFTGSRLGPGEEPENWDIQVVDEAGYVGEFPQLVVDASGDVHVAYFDTGNLSVKYATDRTGVWVSELIDSCRDPRYTYELPYSITVESDGTAHIVYLRRSDGAAIYATVAGETWETQPVTTVASEEDSLEFPVIGVTSIGTLYVACRLRLSDGVNRLLVFRRAAEDDAWTEVTPAADLQEEISADVGRLDMHVDENDVPHILFVGGGDARDLSLNQDWQLSPSFEVGEFEGDMTLDGSGHFHAIATTGSYSRATYYTDRPGETIEETLATGIKDWPNSRYRDHRDGSISVATDGTVVVAYRMYADDVPGVDDGDYVVIRRGVFGSWVELEERKDAFYADVAIADGGVVHSVFFDSEESRLLYRRYP